MASSKRPRPPAGRTQPPRPRPAPSSRPASSVASGSDRPVSWTTPGASPTRAKIETASRSLLVRLHDLPRWILFAVVVLLAIGGAVLRSWPAATCLVIIGALIGWLLYLAWPSLQGVKRTVRLAAVVAVLAAAVAKVVIG